MSTGNTPKLTWCSKGLRISNPAPDAAFMCPWCRHSQQLSISNQAHGLINWQQCNHSRLCTAWAHLTFWQVIFMRLNTGLLHLNPNMQVLGVKVAEPLKITGLQKLSFTHMICVKAVFFPQMGTGSMLCECVLTVCVFDNTNLRTVCLKHDVPLLMSSDHMKHACLLAVLLFSPLFSYMASLWRSGCLGPSSLTNTVPLKEILNQHWTSKGRHKLAHSLGQNRSNLSSYCEDWGGCKWTSGS